MPDGRKVFMSKFEIQWDVYDIFAYRLDLTESEKAAGVDAAARTAIFDQMAPEHIAFMLSKIPMGRFGKVEEIAAMVTWLCTDDCSFSTGAVFDLSGGRSTY